MDNVGSPLAAPKLTWAEHGGRFLAAVENGALSATQFHPEKSGDAGAHLLENWVRDSHDRRHTAPGRGGGGSGRHSPAGGGFSIAKLAFYALGAGALVLAVCIPIIVVCANWSPFAGLAAALVAVVAMIAAIGTVANRMVDRARAELLAAQDRPPH